MGNCVGFAVPQPVHPAAVFTCPECGKEYKSEAGLKKHMEKEHAEAPETEVPETETPDEA